MSNDFYPQKELRSIYSISGPIIVIETSKGVSLGEKVLVEDAWGNTRIGSVLRITQDFTFVQVFGGTFQISSQNIKIKFSGKPFLMSVSTQYLGRIFDGKGNPIDGGPPVISEEKRNINGLPLNPYSRAYPQEFIQTGISAIDGMNSLVRGQKIAIFSGAGLPHNLIAAQILRQATLLEKEEKFVVILAGMGLKKDDAQFFIEEFKRSGSALRSVLFLNLADQPPEERILTPRFALTLAEYLAFEKEMHVLVILVDMTNYCEALREISSFREEIPSRKGYPGYMYTDLASIYERTGRVKNKNGSITQIPILSMPNMDITHPIPDLTGYITEGQIVLSLELHQKGIYPPIDVLPSLSRLMKDGIGKGKTREDHPHLSSQLYYAYSQAKQARSLASIIGEEELSPQDKNFFRFGEIFENEFIKQGFDENRSIEQTLNIGWKTLRVLPKNTLHRLTEEEIQKYYQEE